MPFGTMYGKLQLCIFIQSIANTKLVTCQRTTSEDACGSERTKTLAREGSGVLYCSSRLNNNQRSNSFNSSAAASVLACGPRLCSPHVSRCTAR